VFRLARALLLLLSPKVSPNRFKSSDMSPFAPGMLSLSLSLSLSLFLLYQWFFCLSTMAEVDFSSETTAG
jgi:hypothetical protein